MQRKQLGISVLIVAVLAMQASTFITGTRIWPFMAYCMYATPRYAPSTVSIGVVAQLIDGREMLVDQDVIGLPWHAWNRNFLRPMMEDNHQTAHEVAVRLERLYGTSVATLHVTVTRYRITDAGLEITPELHRFTEAVETQAHGTE